MQEATNELFGSDGATLELVRGRLFVSESDLTILQLAQAVIAEGHAKDVRGEIFESLLTRAYRLGMHDPVLLPHSGVDLRKEFRLLEAIAELGAKDW